MNKKLKKIKQINRKPIPVVAVQPKQTNSILQNIKNMILGFLILTLLIVGFAGVPASAIPFTDSTNLRWNCDSRSFISTTFTCRSYLTSPIEFPSDFLLGVGTDFGGVCTTVNLEIVCSQIPTPNIAGSYEINYQGSGLQGGYSYASLVVADSYLTAAQDLNIPKSCTYSPANTISMCQFELSANTMLPEGYKVGVGSAQDGFCFVMGYNTVSCYGFSSGSTPGPQSLVSTLNPAGANGNFEIFPFLTSDQETNINFSCNPVNVSTNSTQCRAELPQGWSLPQGYKIGVGVDPGGSNCETYKVIYLFSYIICQNVPASSILGEDNINSTLSPAGIGTTAIFGAIPQTMNSLDELTLQIRCDLANPQSTTTCYIKNYNTNSYFIDLGYKLGVGTNPGGICLFGSNTDGVLVSGDELIDIICTNVPTGLSEGLNVRINSTVSPNGTIATSVLRNSPCLKPATFRVATDLLDRFQIFQPVQASAAECRPVVAQGGGGTIQISNQAENVDKKALVEQSVQSSSQSTTSTTLISSTTSTTPVPSILSNLETPTETASTKIYDPFKLKSGKMKPSFGVLSSIDDKASIEDPYVCSGDIHGYVDYSGDYSNVEVIVGIKDTVSGEVTNVPVTLDPITHLYVAKVDYSSVKESNYDINYSVYSRLSKRVLDQGNYSAFITQNCGVNKAIGQNEDVVVLARTGGASDISFGSRLILFLILASFITTKTFEKR